MYMYMHMYMMALNEEARKAKEILHVLHKNN